MTAQPVKPMPGTVVGAVILIAIKALLGVLIGFVLLTISRTGGRRMRLLGGAVIHRHPALGLILLAYVAVYVILMTGLIVRRTWARIATFVAEGLGVLLALTRIGSRPGAALVSIALSVLIVVLLLTPTARVAFAREQTLSP